MARKIFSMYGTAIDEEGKEHIVTVAGVYTQTVTYEPIEKQVQIPVNDKKSVDGTLKFLKKGKKRKLVYAFSICHPDDNFNEEIGKQKALKRVKTNPMGELETKFITSLCPDQINLILYGELKHIINNIGHYIKK